MDPVAQIFQKAFWQMVKGHVRRACSVQCNLWNSTFQANWGQGFIYAQANHLDVQDEIEGIIAVVAYLGMLIVNPVVKS